MTPIDRIRERVRAALDARDFDAVRAIAEPERDERVATMEDLVGCTVRENRDLKADEQRKFNAIRDEVRELDGLIERADADGRRQFVELRRDRAEARAASERAHEQWSTPGGHVRVVSEPRTYDRGSEQRGVSFLRDVAHVALGSADPRLHERLGRHVDEARVDGLIGDGVETRDVGTSAWSGLVVPQYLTDLVAPLARAMAPTVAISNRHPLPESGMTVNISRVTTGSATAAQATENTAVQETDMDDTLLSPNVRTYAGQQDISRQAVERGTGVDTTTMEDLAGAYWSSVDAAVLNSDGTLGTHLGIRNVVGITAVTYTDTTPTVAELYPKLADLLQQCQVATFMGVTHFIMHPRRWWWIASSVGTSFPFLTVPGVGTQQAGAIGGADYLAENRSIFGVPVVLDGNMLTNLGGGTNQDDIIAVTAPELHFWDEGGPKFIRAEQTGASTLTIKFVLYGFSAFTAGRYPAAHGTVSGTGLTTPSFA